MRIVFMGSSDASAWCLRGILRIPGLQVVGVVTQPDRPAGRGKTLTPCPCRAYALKRNITACITPENVNAPEALDQIRAWKPDVIALVAFGQFLGDGILHLAPHGCINCHFSLLPEYRGASPVAAAIADGKHMSGVSVMKIGDGWDNGPVYMRASEPIYEDDTQETLMYKLAVLGGVTLAKALKLLAAGKLPPPVEQEDEKATFAHKIRKTDGLIDWNRKSVEIERRLRAFTPWPGLYTFLPPRFRRKGMTGRLVVAGVEFAKLAPEQRGEMPGTVLACTSRGPVVRTQDSALLLTELKPEGAKMLDGGAFLRGRPLVPIKDMLLPS